MHPIWQIVNDQKKGVARGICSACTAHPLALEACMEKAREDGLPVLIEATANQINQFGGYTGMLPHEFAERVYRIADSIGFDPSMLILGGDHLGPLVWAGEAEESAMEKSDELIRQFVLAGFTKIHIDTSMRLADDDKNAMLSDETIARRSARLAAVAEEAFARLKAKNPDAVHPVYVVGSEVPIPGGATEKEEGVSVTPPENVKNTIAAFERAYAKDAPQAFEHVAALVVQPGVEFGDEDIFEYDRIKAKALTETGKSMGRMVFEGHSTDYQTPEKLKQMVEDGIAILKVGPAVTFALREGLFALADMEKELEAFIDAPSGFKQALEGEMLENPGNWQKHYHGTEAERAFKRRYSLSDRARYYLSTPRVDAAIGRLISNLEGRMSVSLVSQFFPAQYRGVRAGTIECSPKALLLEKVKACIDDYTYAVRP